MNKLKHSKFKNTGILFELLVRQVTADILNNKVSKANDLLSKYFNESTNLGKELQLYQSILKEKSNSKKVANKFLECVISSRKKLKNKNLDFEKYNLVKEIKENFPINDFFRSNVSNYKTLASIYKVFEDKCSNVFVDPKELFQSKQHLLEHITSLKLNKEEKDELLEYYKSQDSDLRLFSFKLLVDSFNKKYDGLNEKQKFLLKEYINNISNTNLLKTYINSEIEYIINELKNQKIKDNKVIDIKIKETINQLNEIKKLKSAKDTHISALLKCYDLIEELLNVK